MRLLIIMALAVCTQARDRCASLGLSFLTVKWAAPGLQTQGRRFPLQWSGSGVWEDFVTTPGDRKDWDWREISQHGPRGAMLEHLVTVEHQVNINQVHTGLSKHFLCSSCKQARLSVTSRPPHWLFLLPGTLFP